MNIESLKFDKNHENIKIDFCANSGLVASTVKYAETHVSGSGNGGSIDVSSYSSINHEVWLKPEQGAEVNYDFTNMNISLREGQKISVISASNSNGKKFHDLCVINHNAETAALVVDTPTICKRLGLIKISDNIALLAILVWVVCLIIGTNGSTILGIIGTAPLVYYYGKHIFPKNRIAIDRINEHLEKIILDTGGFSHSIQ